MALGTGGRPIAIKGIFFDLDGTIAKSLELEIKAYKKTVQAMKRKLKGREVMQYFFHIPLAVAAQNAGITDTKKFSTLLKKEAVRSYIHYRPTPGALSTLKTLKKMNVKLALITSRPSEHLEKALKALKMHSLFDAVVTDSDIMLRKPHPESIHKACKTLGLAPFECAYVGDHRSDVQMALNAGCVSVLFYPTAYKKYYDKKQLLAAKPEFVIRRLEDVVKIAKN